MLVGEHGEALQPDTVVPPLSEEQIRDAESRTSVSAAVVHEAIRKDGDEELQRPMSALAWSGLAAGMSMGFSFLASGLIRTFLPPADWRPLVENLGYPVGFLIVIIGRQQLFTEVGYPLDSCDPPASGLVGRSPWTARDALVPLPEAEAGASERARAPAPRGAANCAGMSQVDTQLTENTLTAIIPLLARRNLTTLLSVLRLWSVVFAANIVGTLLFALALARTDMVHQESRSALLDIALKAADVSFGTAIVRGIFAGWLIAMVVWMRAAVATGQIAIIIILTYVVGLAGLTHIIAGSVEVIYLVLRGELSLWNCIAGYIIPTLIGNILGGTALVSALNHAQVVAGRKSA